MTISPLAFADSLRVGTVDFISPDEIRVLLELDAPEGIALNTGFPHPFPRINGYLLIPSDGSYLVGQVEWITVEHSPFPKRKGMHDFGLIDLPYPLRKLSLNPMGMLHRVATSENGKEVIGYRFQRGIAAFATVGQPVLLPTTDQLRSVVESGDNRHVWIGNSPQAANAEVSVDPNRVFGRHLAVLGNTGSGKSCSVAGLIRWSLEAAENERIDNRREGAGPHARFIVLDPNGEYSEAYNDLSDCVQIRRFAVDPGEGIAKLQVPIWLWNTEEWCAFTQAAPKVQRPVLVQGLRAVRDGSIDEAKSLSTKLRRYLRTLVSSLRISLANGDPWRSNGPIKGFRDRLKAWVDCLQDDPGFTPNERQCLSDFRKYIDELLQSHSGEWPSPFTYSEAEQLFTLARLAHSAFGGSDTDFLPVDPSTPRPFTGEQLLRSIESQAELMNATEHTEMMLMRIRTLLSDATMSSITVAEDNVTLDSWLASYIGADETRKASVTIIDLSLVPAQVVHIITAVIARMTLEAHQRYRKLNSGRVLPTVLVMEEAHTFIKRYKDEAEYQTAAAVCCQVFEKIAREGRKLGLGLVLSSQRPSELSSTVLSQCNTYLLHRVSNDRDQELIHKLLPDNLRGLLRDLPTLPARQAVLLGWASELPVLVEMRHLASQQRPRSDDPDFWEVWSRKNERSSNWKLIADDWQALGVRSADSASIGSEVMGEDEEELPF